MSREEAALSSLSLSPVFELKSIDSECINKPVIQRVRDANLWLRLTLSWSGFFPVIEPF